MKIREFPHHQHMETYLGAIQNMTLGFLQPHVPKRSLPRGILSTRQFERPCTCPTRCSCITVETSVLSVIVADAES